ncbi:MAG: transposase family protein [Verrucomicrobiota bacterium]
MNLPKLLNNPRQLKALTGVSKAEFDDLLPVFESCYYELQKNKSLASKRRFGAGPKGKLLTSELKLFFILIYTKVYPTFDVLGFLVDFDRSRACRNTHFLLSALEKSLGRKIVLPERKIRSVEELFRKFPDLKDVFVDGLERPVQRPRKQKQQRKLYSGKKKTHTKKSVVMIDEKKHILFLTKTKSGRRHDKRLADKQALFEGIPESVTVWADTGFLGAVKQHHNTMIPKKATKSNPLTYQEKQDNKVISGLRVIVEHAIGGIKRFRSVADIYRNKKAFLEDRFLRVAAGLWNLHLQHTA